MIENSLRTHLVKANQNMGRLTILVDPASHKMAAKLYNEFISPDDYGNFPAFIQELDMLLRKYGARHENGQDDERHRRRDIDKEL